MRGGRRIPYFLRRRALLIPRRGRGRTQFCGQRPQLLSKALPSAEYFAPRARDEGNPPSRRGTVGPTISFLEKEMVPPGGIREKSSGPSSWSSYLKLKCAPTPHSARRKRLHPAKIPRPKRRGLRGNMVPPSNRARPAMRCRTAFPQKCRDCPPGVFSLGPLQRPVLFLRQKENGGLGSTPLGGGKKRGLWPQKKVRPAPAARNDQRFHALF